MKEVDRKTSSDNSITDGITDGITDNGDHDETMGDAEEACSVVDEMIVTETVDKGATEASNNPSNAERHTAIPPNQRAIQQAADPSQFVKPGMHDVDVDEVDYGNDHYKYNDMDDGNPLEYIDDADDYYAMKAVPSDKSPPTKGNSTTNEQRIDKKSEDNKARTSGRHIITASAIGNIDTDSIEGDDIFDVVTSLALDYAPNRGRHEPALSRDDATVQSALVVQDATLVPEATNRVSLPQLLTHEQMVEHVRRNLIANAQHAEEVPYQEHAQRSDRPTRLIIEYRKLSWTMIIQFSIFTVCLVGAVAGITTLYMTRCSWNPNTNGCNSNESTETNRPKGTVVEIGPVCDQAIDIGLGATQLSLLSVSSSNHQSQEHGIQDDKEQDGMIAITCVHPGSSTPETTSTSPMLFTGYQAWFNLAGTGTPITVTAKKTVASTADSWIVAYAYADEEGCDDIMAGDQPICMAKQRYNEEECTLTIATSADQHYKMVIGGNEPYEFKFDVHETMANDVCQVALPIAEDVADLKVGSVITGSNRNATEDADIARRPCIFEGSGSWYSVVGTGVPWMASTCASNQNEDGSLDNVAVLVGDCFNLQCAADADYVTCGSENQVTWPTQKGETYYLVVTSSTDEASGEDTMTAQATSSAQGIRGHSTTATVNDNMSVSIASQRDDFRLMVRETVERDICHAAKQINLVTNYNRFVGSNLHSSSDSMPTCRDDLITKLDVDATSTVGTWWAVEGTGMLLRVSTCLTSNLSGPNANQTDLSARVHVFRGSCSELECIDENVGIKSEGNRQQRQKTIYHRECSSRDLNEVIWLSEVGVQYFILVSSQVYPELIQNSSEDADGLSTATPSPEPIQSPKLASSSSTTADFEVAIRSVASNDICEAAAPLNPASNATIFGSTLNATVPTEFVLPCGTATTVSAPGVWYSLIGGNTFVTVDSPCHLDIPSDQPQRFMLQFTVLSGDCDALQCVVGMRAPTGRCSTVTWFAREGQKYNILIHGTGVERGEFRLFVSERYDSIQGGEGCIEAEGPLEVQSAMGLTNAGQQQVSGTACGLFTSGPASWYTLKGNGKRLVASTCRWTRFDSRVAIFRGANCESLQCMPAEYTLCDNGSHETSVAEFDSEVDVMYYVLVYGGDHTDTLTQLTIAEAMPNNECDQSKLLMINGDPVDGSILGVRSGQIQHCFDDFEIMLEFGVWYAVTAIEKSQLSAQVCSIDERFGVMVNVYSGMCGNATCVDGVKYRFGGQSCEDISADDYDASSNPTWIAEAGESFLIFVGGEQFNSDKFQISVTGQKPIENDECNTASPIGFDERIYGSFQRVTEDNAPSPCNHLYTFGAWYSIRGTGRLMTASTCNNDLVSQSYVTVATGDCSNLACVDSSGGFCGKNGQVSWESEEGVLYYVAVATEGFSFDEFTLIVNGEARPVPLPAYDECEGATRLQVHDGTMVEMSTQLASVDEVGSCGRSSNIQTIGGIWVVVEGSGSILKLSAHASGRQSQAKLAVFQGSCGSLSCIEGNTQEAEVAEAFFFTTWFAEEGSDYHVLVFDAFPSVTLAVESVENGAQARCESTMDIDVADMLFIALGDSIIGTTGGGIEDFVDPCSNEILPMGSWLSLLGSGERVRVSIRNDSTEFVASMKVYEGGDCAALVCTEAVSSDCDGVKAEYTYFDWGTEPNTIYRIYIHGADGSAGVFELSTSLLVLEDVCDGAISLLPGMEVNLEDSKMFGPDTSGTACDDVSSVASSTLMDGPGVWYRVIGTGNTMIASTCNPDSWLLTSTFEDTHISVLTGDCDNLECIHSNDDYCGTQSRVIWSSELRRVYFVLVRIKPNFLESYKLSLSELVESQSCESSALQPVARNTEMTSSLSFSDQQQDDVVLCSDDDSSSDGGVWFTTVGTGLYMMATTCGPDTRFNSSVMVYTSDGEDCGDLQCVYSAAQTACGGWLKEGSMSLKYSDSDGAAAVQQGSVTWSSILGELYYLYVSMDANTDNVNNDDTNVDHGITIADEALFSLKVRNVAANDVCQHAMQLSPGDFKSGVFSTATIDYGFDICNKPYFWNHPLAPPDSPGVWYRVSLEAPVGENADVTGVRVKTCHSKEDSDSERMTIFAGDSCGELECLNTYHQSIRNDCLSVDLTPDLGMKFYILIHQIVRLEASHFRVSVEEIRT